MRRRKEKSHDMTDIEDCIMYCTSRYPHETSASVTEEIDRIMSRLETSHQNSFALSPKSILIFMSRQRSKKAFGVRWTMPVKSLENEIDSS
jgi:hypothetical protein